MKSILNNLIKTNNIKVIIHTKSGKEHKGDIQYIEEDTLIIYDRYQLSTIFINISQIESVITQ